MKALFYPAYDQLTIEELPVPAYADNEVLVKVAACGICGSELETFKTRSRRRIPPLIMGHEFCGTILEKGKKVAGWENGERVISNSVVSCGHCENCISGKSNLGSNRQIFGMHRNGAFGMYVNVPASSLIKMPATAKPNEVCLSEPLANGIHMVNLTRHIPIKNVLVIGAGPIGLMAQQAFKVLRHANIIVSDLKDERLNIAKKLGASGIINPSRNNGDISGNYLKHGHFDVVVDAVGSAETNKTGLKVVRPGGVLLAIGLYKNNNSLYSYDIVLSEKTVMGSYAATQQEIEEAALLIVSGKVDVSSWVNYYDIDEGAQAFYNMMEARGNHIKSVIIFEHE